MLSSTNFKEMIFNPLTQEKFRIRYTQEDKEELEIVLSNLGITILDVIDLSILGERGVITAPFTDGVEDHNPHFTELVFRNNVLYTPGGIAIYNLSQDYLPKEDLIKLIKDLPLGSLFTLYYRDKSIVVNKFIPLLKKLNIVFHYDDYREPNDKSVIHCRLLSTTYSVPEGLRLNQYDHVIELVLHDTCKHFSIR